MKAVILAGGRGTRLSEETGVRPKPLVEIGGRPILWHICKIYAAHGITDFVICLGYLGWQIREYFLDFARLHSDLTIDLSTGAVEVLRPETEPWRVSLIETGGNSQTGGRIARVGHLLHDEEAFCLTYGDGVSNVDVAGTIAFHRAHKRQATVTAVVPPGRFGALDCVDGRVRAFTEKPAWECGLINGGFFVLSPAVLDRIEGDATVWEGAPLQSLAADGELMAWEHRGFWQPMDTMRDRDHLRALWETGRAPWKVW
jgi:glucose-1-phosphate cytidylyltransferase